MSLVVRRTGATVARARLFAVFLLGLAVAACGGGGGGGGGSSAPAGAFTLSANSAAFTAIANAAPPAARSIALTVTGGRVAFVGAAYDAGQSQPPWLGIELTGSGNNYTLTLRILSTSLPAGDYSSTFAVGTADSAGNVLQRQNVTVTYSVTPAIGLSASPRATSFIFGDTRSTQAMTIDVQAAGRQWTITSSAPWLPVPGATQSGNASLAATLDAGSLAPGSYSATLTVTSAANAADTASLTVTAVVEPATLAVSAGDVLLGGQDGRAQALQQALGFSLQAGNGVHPYTVTLTTDDGGSWLAVDSTSGNVGSGGRTLNFSASRDGLAGGTRTGEARIDVDVKGTVLTERVPVTFNLEASRLVATAAGVGLTSAPGRDVLTRSVKVLSNLGRADIPWTATSSQPWLSVTPSGLTGGEVALTADPAGLAPEATYYADVTVASGDARVENTQTIRVGLYVTAAAPSAVLVDSGSAYLAASPVEPLVATSDFASGTVALRNVYTGATVRTLSGAVSQAGGMVFSGDGRTLYVHDTSAGRVVALAVASGAEVGSYDASAAQPGDGIGQALAFLRPAGFPMLVAPGSRIFEVESGIERSTPDFRLASNAFSLATSLDQSLVVADFGAVRRFERSALAGGSLRVTDAGGAATAQGRQGEACISADGDRVYTASGFPYNFPATSLATGQVVQVLPANPYPNAIQCVWNGFVVGGIDGFYDATDIWVYDGPSGANLGQLSSSDTGGNRSLADRGLAVSADGARVVSIVQKSGVPNRQLYFQSLPPR